MTIRQTLIWAAKKLNIFTSSASLDAEILLSYILKKNKEYLFTNPQKKIGFLNKLKLIKLIAKRQNGLPIAYLTGEKEFYGRKFFINKNVLVPRPLTEKIIDLALTEITKPITIIDVGTGSGIIIITLAKELEKKFDLSQFKLYGLDISAKALKVAKKNAQLQQIDKNITFFKSDLLKAVKNKPIDLILANLPYLEPSDLKEPSIKKEPTLALVGNYQKLFKQIDLLPYKPIVIIEDKTGVYKK